MNRGRKNFNRNGRHGGGGGNADSEKWSHDAFEGDDDDGMAVDNDQHHRNAGASKASGRKPGGGGPEPYVAAITNLHWNVSESDLKELFGPDSLVSLTLSYDNAGRSEGIATAVFKTKEFAVQAQENFNGELLDGRELQIELQGPQVKKKLTLQKKPTQGKKGGIESRLGPTVFSRLAPKLEDRLGKKLEDRLGNKKNTAAKSKKLKGMDVDKIPTARQVKSYADIN